MTRIHGEVWIIRNQFGRRNLQPFQRAELALQLEPLIAAKAKENQVARKGEQAGTTPQISAELKPVDTRKEIAASAGVSHDTIHKAKLIAAKATDAVKDKLRRGTWTTAVGPLTHLANGRRDSFWCCTGAAPEKSYDHKSMRHPGLEPGTR